MNTDEAHEYSVGVRNRSIPVTEELVAKIEQTVKELARVRANDASSLPPDDQVELLWDLGWLIYEASFALTREVSAGYESSSDPARRKTSSAASALVDRLAETQRTLAWPEFAPRALGAIRAAALVASKRDTDQGYSDAWALHQEASTKYLVYRESLVIADPRYLLALQETQIQLVLAETGTACRTAERVLGRWLEGVRDQDWQDNDEAEWIHRMFSDLSQRAIRGEQALELVAEIEKQYGLATAVDRHRMALRTAYRNPGIMTARAYLLLVPMCLVMADLGWNPPAGHSSWDEARETFLNRFERAYRAIETLVKKDNDDEWSLEADHQRSVIQLRLGLGLIAPGTNLPSKLAFDPCLAYESLDDAAVAAMSGWLAESTQPKQQQRGDANVIGSVTMPSYLKAIANLRAASDAQPDGYLAWRRQWPQLDRYYGEEGRLGIAG